MKPTLLLFFGYGWAATSPLAYTLQRLAKYCHMGWVKNFNYLQSGIEGNPNPVVNTLFNKINNGEVSLENWCDYETYKGHRINFPSDLEPLQNFPLSKLQNLIEQPATLDRYIDYYKTVWECVQPYGYKAIADFSCCMPEHGQVQRNHLTQGILDELKKHFVIKSLVIVRDPVRRGLGHYIRYFMNAKVGSSNHNGHPGYQPHFPNYLFYWDLQKQLIPDSHMVIMENLWGGSKREIQALSDFLDTPIEDLWPNLYVPDKGHYLNGTWNPDEFCPTPCQLLGMSDVVVTPDNYYLLKERIQYMYDDWQQRFGILPRTWGRPIDYAKHKDFDYNATMPYLVEKYNLDLGKYYNL